MLAQRSFAIFPAVPVTLDSIREAAQRIAGRVHRTPLLSSRSFDAAASAAHGRELQVRFKCENLQRAGAFKARGATNRIRALDAEERRRGVAAYSSGNHAQAVALAAREAGSSAVIVMPADAPRAKLEATRAYGARIVLYDRARESREEIGRELAAREGRTLVPPYDDELVIAGQGTCGLEIVEDAPGIDAFLAPCSGGGLFAGSSVAVTALAAGARCFPVEPEAADDTRRSLAAGHRVTIPLPPTMADGLRSTSPGELTFPILQRTAEAVLTVSEAEIAAALAFLLFRLKLLVEPSGAVAAAAVLAGKLPPGVQRPAVILSGGNIDRETLAALLAAGVESTSGARSGH